MNRPAHPWPFPVQPMPAAVEAVAIRAKGNHLVAAQDEPELLVCRSTVCDDNCGYPHCLGPEPEADESIATRDLPMPVSRHPAIVAGEADARAILRTHTATTKRSGTGLSDSIRAVCTTCNWQGPEHFEYEDNACSAAAADARAHVAAPSQGDA